MSEFKITNINPQPEFDLEDFMNFSKESRISSETLTQIEKLFNQWYELIEAKTIQTNKNSWVIVWMPEDVEKYIDEKWDQTPGEGYLLNMLAQYMCMTAIENLIPNTAGNGCAPLPELSLPLENALRELKLLSKDSPTIIRRYSILTYYPLSGGCEICSLNNSCPKLKGSSDFSSWVLKGHEKGI